MTLDCDVKISVTYRSQRILLRPTRKQVEMFSAAAGYSRFAWNWALALCQRHYRVFGKRAGYKRIGVYRLCKHWNKVKDRRFPWARKYSKYIQEESFRKLDLAYAAAFKKFQDGQPLHLPRLRSKWVHESFQVIPSGHKPIRNIGPRFNLPRIGWVKVQGALRWPSGKQLRGRVKLKAGRWWLILTREIPILPKLPDGRPACGIDLGCKTFATVASGGEIVEELAPPKPYAKAKKKLKRLQRWKDRKVKGSVNRGKAIRRVGRFHERVANIRDNFLHQFTSRLTKKYGVIVLEDLSVKGMMGGMLSKTIGDLGFGEFRRQVEYKAEATGTRVVLANRFYPSSKTCSSCGLVKTKLELHERSWMCECGVTHNRDHNAARNLEKLGRNSPESTPVESGGSGRRKASGAARRSRNATARGAS